MWLKPLVLATFQEHTKFTTSMFIYVFLWNVAKTNGFNNILRSWVGSVRLSESTLLTVYSRVLSFELWFLSFELWVLCWYSSFESRAGEDYLCIWIVIKWLCQYFSWEVDWCHFKQDIVYFEFWVWSLYTTKFLISFMPLTGYAWPGGVSRSV